mgnify:CR=1 FL=1
MDYSYLKIATDNGITVVSINRPDALNAMNSRVMAELYDYFSGAGSDDSVQAVILTGAGEKAFVAGADIKEMKELTALESKEFAKRGHKLTMTIQQLGKPVVAAVNGYALGGGCELAIACHLRFAAANAIFGQPEVGLGIIPGWGGTQRLPRLIGVAKATELIISGKSIDAATAKNIGLVNEIFDQEDLLEKSKEFLQTVMKQGPRAVELSLEAIYSGMDMPLSEGLNLEANLFGVAFSTEDSNEGTEAFVQKRSPEFQGR